eukprot:ANDGO_08022.mRNA.1 Eukaryotic translation initiation factor 3 subunit D-1
MSFTLPFSTTAGWGPAPTTDTSAVSVPFSVFDHTQKLGKVADFLTTHSRVQGVRAAKAEVEKTSSTFAYSHEAEDSSFKEVETRGATRQRAGRRPTQQGAGGPPFGGRGGGQRGRFGHFQRGGFSSNRPGFSRPGGSGRGQRVVNPTRFDEESLEPSIQIDRQWNKILSFEFQELSKKTAEVSNFKELSTAGRLRYFDVRAGDVAPRDPRGLDHLENVDFLTHVNASSDPVLVKMQQEKNPKDKTPTLYSTDAALTALMCAPRAVFSFDLVLRKEGNVLVLDKRDGSTLDLQTVNESDNFPPTNEDKASANSQDRLTAEATYVSQCFSQQALSEEAEDLGPIPVGEATTGKPADVGFYYRSFVLPDGTEVVYRTEVSSLVRERGETKRALLRSLLEYDTPSKWAQELQKSRAGMLLTQIQRNLFVAARWASQAYLGDISTIKVAFVTRVGSSDKHRILAVENWKPESIRSPQESYGVLAAVINAVRQQPDGLYLLFKPPAQSALVLYSLPSNAFESAEDDVDDEDDAAGDDEDVEDPMAR